MILSTQDPPRLPLTCALFTRERQEVIAGDVIPLSLFMPDHHHAVLSSSEEVVRLPGAPFLKLLWAGVGLGKGRTGQAIFTGLVQPWVVSKGRGEAATIPAQDSLSAPGAVDAQGVCSQWMSLGGFIPLLWATHSPWCP